MINHAGAQEQFAGGKASTIDGSHDEAPHSFADLLPHVGDFHIHKVDAMSPSLFAPKGPKSLGRKAIGAQVAVDRAGGLVSRFAVVEDNDSPTAPTQHQRGT